MTAFAHRVGWDLRLQQRYGIHYAALYVAALWLIIAFLLPDAWRAPVLPYILFMDVAIFGIFFLPALRFLERDERTLPALRVSPLGSSRYLLARGTALLLPSLAIGLVVAAGSRVAIGSWALLTAALALTVVLNLLGGFIVASRFPSVQAYFMPAGFLLIGFQLPAIEPFVAAPADWLWLTPTYGAWRMLRASLGGPILDAAGLAVSLAHAAVVAAALWPVAVRAVDRFAAPTGASRWPSRGRESGRQATRSAAWAGWIGTLVRLDMRLVARNSMYGFLLVALVLLFAVVRWALPSVEAGLAPWIDLAGQRPLVWTFFGVLYIPAMIGSLVGLMLLDERDEGALLAVRATPVTLRRYLGYRMGLATVLSVVYAYLGMAAFHPMPVTVLQFAPTAALAALETPLAALFVAGVARNKVEGLALTKALGAPFFASLVAWFTPWPWRWLLAVFPTFWPAQALWWVAEGRSLAGVAAFAVVGAVFHVALIALLWRRFVRRVG